MHNVFAVCVWGGGGQTRLMKLYGHADQVSTIQGVLSEDADGSLWKLLLGWVEQVRLRPADGRTH